MSEYRVLETLKESLKNNLNTVITSVFDNADNFVGTVCPEYKCEYVGKMETANGPKDFYLIDDDGNEYRVPHRISVSICPKCKKPDWRTLG